MNTSELVAALKEFAGSAIEVTPEGNHIFELTLRGIKTKKRVFCRFILAPNEDRVDEIHYSCLCGILRDSRAFPTLLKKNYGGVMGTEYYFSGREMDGRFYLILEAKYSVERDVAKTDAIEFFRSAWENPLLMTEWDFPQGVENFLW